MSKHTNPNQPERGTNAARTAAGDAKRKLKQKSSRYLAGFSTPQEYAETHRRLSAIIIGGGLEMPDVALPELSEFDRWNHFHDSSSTGPRGAAKSMKKNQPASKEKATPRKRAPGAGRPSMGRTANLPRIRPEAHARLVAMAAARGEPVAGTLERLIAGAGAGD